MSTTQDPGSPTQRRRPTRPDTDRPAAPRRSRWRQRVREFIHGSLTTTQQLHTPNADLDCVVCATSWPCATYSAATASLAAHPSPTAGAAAPQPGENPP